MKIFIALGHDPDWRLEIILPQNKIVFTTDSVTTTYFFATDGPTLIATTDSTCYVAINTDHQMSVVVREKFCQDIQSGKAYGATVSVWFDDKQFNGCGAVAGNDATE